MLYKYVDVVLTILLINKRNKYIFYYVFHLLNLIKNLKIMDNTNLMAKRHKKKKLMTDEISSLIEKRTTNENKKIK